MRLPQRRAGEVPVAVDVAADVAADLAGAVVVVVAVDLVVTDIVMPGVGGPGGVEGPKPKPLEKRHE